MKNLLNAILVIWCVCAFSVASAEVVSTEVVTDNAHSQFFSEKAGISPGETITVGFHQKLRKGWHVYWSNPGDSGLPLDLKWEMPEGFVAGDIQYPIPHRLPLEFLMNYGHEGEPTFLVDITAPDTLPIGENITFNIEATWLICEKLCIPEQGAFTLSLPAVAAPAAKDENGAPIIDMARLDLPIDADFTANFYDDNGTPVLHLNTDKFDGNKNVHFFPYTSSLIEPAGDEIISAKGEGLTIRFSPGYEYNPSSMTELDGVLTVKNGRSLQGFVVRPIKTEAPENNFPANATATPAIQGSNASLFGILGLALIGGIILNIMPCVFPIVFMKAASLAKVAHSEAKIIRRHGLLYTLGVIVTFAALATMLIVLRAGGEQIGWGFHLQSPFVVSLFAIVILLVGLNLAGLFEIGTSIQGVGSDLAHKGGNAGAFFTGLLAVAVAAPCIGPFLGVPVGYALTQPAPIGIAVFVTMGLGLALPYLLISFVPGLARILPRPGAWMETFKQFLSFAMFGTLIWLIWTLTLQAGTDGLVLLLVALLLVSFAAWLFGKSQVGKGIVTRIVALIVFVLALFVINDIEPQIGAQKLSGDIVSDEDKSVLPSIAYSEKKLAELRASGTPVFVDFTAAWCVTCQFNKQRVLTKPSVVEAFHEKDVVYMVADWTLQDEEITKALSAQDRSGVPLYLYYEPYADGAQILPQILTIDMVLDLFSVL